MTDDKVEEVSEDPEGILMTIVKYLYFPVYALSLAKGRLKYISYMIGIALMIALMFFLNFACAYLGQGPVSPNSLMMLIAPLLAMSKLRYFLKLPGHADYDFCNIFLETGIFRVSVVTGVGLLVNSFSTYSI